MTTSMPFTRIVEEILGLHRKTSTRERERVWKSFRDACRYLGLELNSRDSGGGYIVEEYLHQAGLPLTFVGKVAESMLRTADEVGLPDDDDPIGITRWQEYLQTKDQTSSEKRLRMTLIRDVTGFYVRTFLTAVNTAAPQGTDSVAGLMAMEIRRLDHHGSRNRGWRSKLSIARLLLRDDSVVIELPSGDGQEWSITVDGEHFFHLGETVPSILPLLDVLPRTIEIQSSKHLQQFAIWPDTADNHLLVFDADGKFFQSATLGQQPLKLPPGEFTLLLRFEPAGDHVTQCISQDPSHFISYFAHAPARNDTYFA